MNLFTPNSRAVRRRALYAEIGPSWSTTPLKNLKRHVRDGVLGVLWHPIERHRLVFACDRGNRERRPSADQRFSADIRYEMNSQVPQMTSPFSARQRHVFSMPQSRRVTSTSTVVNDSAITAPSRQCVVQCKHRFWTQGPWLLVLVGYVGHTNAPNPTSRINGLPSGRPSSCHLLTARTTTLVEFTMATRVESGEQADDNHTHTFLGFSSIGSGFLPQLPP